MEKKIDLRIQKTYHSLNLAFTRLMEQKNFEDITVNELCDAAMIRRTTFYKHFADKYEYFKFYIYELSESFKSQVSSEKLLTDPLSYSVSMLHELFQFVQSHKKLVEGLRNSNMMSFLYQSLQELFVKELCSIFILINGNHLNPQTELLISFYAGGLINVVYWWMSNPTTLSEEAIAELLVKSITPPAELLL